MPETPREEDVEEEERYTVGQWGVGEEGKEGKWRCGCNFPLTLVPSFPSPPPRRQPPGALLGDAGRCGVGGWAAFPLSSGPGRSANPPPPSPTPGPALPPQDDPANPLILATASWSVW